MIYETNHRNYQITVNTDEGVSIYAPGGRYVHTIPGAGNNAELLTKAGAFINAKLPAITNRGFDIEEFADLYDNKCSLQKSSLATEDCIWFGIADPRVQERVPDGVGWRDVELPDSALISSRMHLTQDMVRNLLPYLQRFADTGELR